MAASYAGNSMISVIVPMYNESKRMDAFLPQLVSFLAKTYSTDYELLLIDDGSKDATAQKAKDILYGRTGGRLITYQPNRGKGAAIKEGVLQAKGEKIIFIDADGSIAPSEIPKIIDGLDTHDIVVSSRVHRKSDVTINLTRKLTGKIFNLYVRLLFQSPICDNLCGFKGFRKEAARNLFSELISQRWIFDVEIFWRAKNHGYTVLQVPITWKWKSGSKIHWYDPFVMAWQLLELRIELMDVVKHARR